MSSIFTGNLIVQPNFVNSAIGSPQLPIFWSGLCSYFFIVAHAKYNVNCKFEVVILILHLCAGEVGVLLYNFRVFWVFK